MIIYQDENVIFILHTNYSPPEKNNCSHPNCFPFNKKKKIYINIAHPNLPQTIEHNFSIVDEATKTIQSIHSTGFLKHLTLKKN